MEESFIVSPMNYIGNKKRLLETLLEIFPQNVGTFYDIFCGGLSVGINSSSDRVVFNDKLEPLISLYKEFQNKDTDEIFSHIDGRIEEFNLSKTNKDGYLLLRDLYNSDRNHLDLFVLMAYSFNNQIRFNKSMKFNNPFGKDRSHFNSNMRENLKRFLDAIKGKEVEFTSKNFTEFDFSKVGEEDFVYLDPPYLITGAAYNVGWGEEEERSLLSILDKLDERGVRFALSNVLEHKGRENHILEVWADRAGIYIHNVDVTYANSSYNTSRLGSKEVVVTNYKMSERQVC